MSSLAMHRESEIDGAIEIARATTALTESESATCAIVACFFPRDDDSDNETDSDIDSDAMTPAMDKNEESDDGADADADDTTDDGDGSCEATDASSSDSDADADTQATATMPDSGEVARLSSTKTTPMASRSSSTVIKCAVFDLAKRMYVLAKIAMAAISRECVAAMQWVLGVCGMRGGAKATASNTATMTRSSRQDGSSSSSSSFSSTSRSVSASVSSLLATPTPISSESASHGESHTSRAASNTSADIPVAIEAIKKTIVKPAVVSAENNNSEPASTIEVVAVVSESESDNEVDEKVHEQQQQHLASLDSEDQQHLVVVIPPPSPPIQIAMAPCAMWTRALMEAAIVEQLKCEDQLVNVLRCVLLASNWHAQAEAEAPVSSACACRSASPVHVRIHVTRVGYTASVPVYEPVIGTTALLSVCHARAALVHQREMVNSAVMACCATMACLTTAVDALQSVRGGDHDGDDGGMIEDALWLFDREEQLVETAWLAFRWIDQLLDALDTVDEAEGGEKVETTTSVERAGVVSAWCEPPEDDVALDAAWARWVETWANEMAPATYETRAMPRENLTPAERAYVEKRISLFGESVRVACLVKVAAVVAAVAEPAVVVPVAPVVEAASSSKTSTTATEAAEAAEATEATEAKTLAEPVTTACGTLVAPTTSSPSEAAATASRSTVDLRRGASPTCSSTSSSASASTTPAMQPKPKSEIKSTRKTSTKARWR